MITGDSDTKAAYIHGKSRSLSPGQDVLLSDRSRALTVTGRHSRSNYSSSRHGPYHVIELEGNQTEYHLLCWERASHCPMLYKKSAWEENEDDPRIKWDYPRRNERVTNIKVGQEDEGG